MPGREGVNPLPQHQAKTLFLRVPSQVWPMVSTGRISEFRAAIGNVPQLWVAPLPSLCVAYRKRRSVNEFDYRLMVLEAIRREALGAITDEGLERAGYTGPQAMARFRREWMIAEKRKFEPLRTVVVFTVKVIAEQDYSSVGMALLRHLYGEYIGTKAERAPHTIKTNGQSTKGVHAYR